MPDQAIPPLAPRGARRYIYQSVWKRLAAGCFDAAGGLLVLLATGGRGLRFQPQHLQPRRILAVRLDHIGDVLFFRPSLQALRTLYPQSHITVLASSAGAQLLKSDPM